ncbi:Golgin subfamily A member 7, partial [Trichinella pseudospiralis]
MRKSENIDCIMSVVLEKCPKIFILRDYSSGTAVRFQTKLPQELVGRIDEQLFEKCIQTLNEIFAKAEKLTWKSFFENIIGCFTCYLSHLCMEYQFSKQNETVFIPHGLFITDPIERGLRMIEISILNNVNVTQSPAV